MRARIPKPIGAIILTASLAAAIPQAFGFPEGYSIGLNFGADEYPNSVGAGTLAPAEVAGVPGVAQAHWNNLELLNGSGSGLVADNKGAEASTSATVEWDSAGTWSSTGRGEENNAFPSDSPNYKLMVGYLDTGDPTTTTVTISGLPAALTSGYDVYVYMLGGVGGTRGGGYRITDASGTVLRDYLVGDGAVNPSEFVRDLGFSHTDQGTFLVFRGLTAANIKVEATTEAPNGLVRAPINAIQLVAAALDKTAPTVPANFAAAEIGANRVNLKWDAATDNSSTVFYEVEADGQSVGKVLAPAYVASGLLPKTAHTYRVRAWDDSANSSAWTASVSVTTVDQTASNGYLKFEYWTGMESGTAVDLLTWWIAEGHGPNLISYTPTFDSRPVFPDDSHEQYGARISGWLTPLESGDYTFFLRSDDASELWLSTTDKESDLVKIAEQTGCCNNFTEPDGTGGPAYTSLPINLTATKKYFVQLLYKEGGGGDYGQVAWRKAGDSTAAGALTPIPSVYLSSLVDAVGAQVTLTGQPANTTATEGTAATFRVTADAKSPYVTEPAYQWFKNGALIPNATAATYTTPEVSLTSDNGAKYTVWVAVPGASSTSAEATLTVVQDKTAPKVKRAAAGSVQAVTVTFDEPVEKTSAETVANYALSGGVTVSQAVLGGSANNVVRLTTSSMTVNAPYTLTVGGVKDRFNNAVPAGTQVNFTAKVVTYADIIMSDQPIGFYRFEETTGQKTKNYGSAGESADGLYMMGTGPDDSIPVDAAVAEGPRPSEFLGFDPGNRAVVMDGLNTTLWIDTQKQFLNGLRAFSLEYWVKPAKRVSDPDAFGTRIGLVGQNDAVEYGFINQTTIQIWSAGGGSLDTTYSFPDDEWHHIATIADGTTIKNYYDGVLVGTGGTRTSNYGSSTFNVHIGGGGVYDATGNFFTGQFDEVAIFDKAIPADRILAHYKAGKEGGEVPEEPTSEVKFTQVSLAGGQVTIAWEGTGTLEEATAVTGPWTTAASQTNPQTIAATGAGKFYRVRQ
ncbi:MAG: LamG-like jellyroll fold domain-containing protein [Verrucomicrobiia bacterium]